jgi:hypothetical protein
MNYLLQRSAESDKQLLALLTDDRRMSEVRRPQDTGRKGSLQNKHCGAPVPLKIRLYYHHATFAVNARVGLT